MGKCTQVNMGDTMNGGVVIEAESTINGTVGDIISVKLSTNTINSKTVNLTGTLFDTSRFIVNDGDLVKVDDGLYIILAHGVIDTRDKNDYGGLYAQLMKISEESITFGGILKFSDNVMTPYGSSWDATFYPYHANCFYGIVPVKGDKKKLCVYCACTYGRESGYDSGVDYGNCQLIGLLICNEQSLEITLPNGFTEIRQSSWITYNGFNLDSGSMIPFRNNLFAFETTYYSDRSYFQWKGVYQLNADNTFTEKNYTTTYGTIRLSDSAKEEYAMISDTETSVGTCKKAVLNPNTFEPSFYYYINANATKGENNIIGQLVRKTGKVIVKTAAMDQDGYTLPGVIVHADNSPTDIFEPAGLTKKYPAYNVMLPRGIYPGTITMHDLFIQNQGTSYNSTLHVWFYDKGSDVIRSYEYIPYNKIGGGFSGNVLTVRYSDDKLLFWDRTDTTVKYKVAPAKDVFKFVIGENDSFVDWKGVLVRHSVPGKKVKVSMSLK